MSNHYLKNAMNGCIVKRIFGLMQLVLIIFATVGLLTIGTICAKKVFEFASNEITLNESTEYIDGRIAVKYHKQGFKLFSNELNLDPKYFSEYKETGIKLKNQTWYSFIFDDEFIWYEVALQPETSVNEAMNILKLEKNVVCVEPIYIRTKFDVLESGIEDELYNDQDYMNLINLNSARNHLESIGINRGGSSDVVVAVIDTGVDYNHEDLKNNIWINTAEIPENNYDDDGNGYIDDYYGYSSVDNNGNSMDVNGHGTHVAGIIAAENNGIGIEGIAYNVKIMAIKAASPAGIFTTSSIIGAIKYASINGADIINMSFAGTQYSVQEEDALQAAYNTAILVAASGNNAAPNNPIGPNFYPASYESVIGVMASTSSNTVASFSNYDYEEYDYYEYEVCAPGVNLMSTIPNGKYRKLSGTSMASPVVAAIAALVRSKFSDHEKFNTRFIVDQVIQTANPNISTLGCITTHNYFTSVDAYNALTKAPEPSLKIDDYFIIDDPSISSVNDGDGVMDSGETIYIGAIVQNRWGKATNTIVNLNVTSDLGVVSPYIEIIHGTINYGDIGAGNTVGNGIIYDDEGVIIDVTDPFIIQVSEDTPNDCVHQINFYSTCENGYDETDEKTYEYYLYVLIASRKGKEVPNLITTDMVLTKENLWIVNNMVTIKEGATLTIEEGTKVQFWSSDPDDIYGIKQIAGITVKGNLIVNGTKENPVQFVTSELFRDFTIEIEKSNNGVIILNNAEIENPYIIGAKYIDGCYFVQNGEAIYRRDVNAYEGTVSENFSYPYVDAVDIQNSIFYALGDNPMIPWLQLYVNGNLKNNLFSCCKTIINQSDNCDKVIEGNVFVNSSRSNNTYLTTKIYVGYNSPSFSVVDGVRNDETGVGYLLVSAANYEMAARFAKYVGGYLASINTQKEQSYLENIDLVSDTYYIGYQYDSPTTSFVWADGSKITFDQVSNPESIGRYVIMNESNWTKTESGNLTKYYLVEIPTNTLIDDFSFAQETIFLDENELAYDVDILFTPSTGDVSTLVYSSSDETVFKITANNQLQAVGQGTAILTIKTKDEFVSHSIEIQVGSTNEIESINIKNENTTIALDQLLRLPITILPFNTTEKVIYTSSNESIVSIDRFGNIKGISVGFATVSASNVDGTIIDSIDVQVIIPIEELSLTESIYEVELSSGVVELPEIFYAPINATDVGYTYETSDSSIAFVNAEGKLVLSTIGIVSIRINANNTTGIYVDLIVHVVENKSEEVKMSKIVESYLNFNNNWNNYYLGLTQNGDVWIWGAGIKFPQKTKLENVKDIKGTRDFGNSFIALYDDGTITTSINGEKIADISNVIVISSSNDSYVVLKDDGTLYGWGNNPYGKLCTGNEDYVSTPTIMPDVPGVIDVAQSYYNVYLLLSNGQVYYSGGHNQLYSFEILTGIGNVESFESNAYEVYAYSERYLYVLHYSGYYIQVESLDGYSLPSSRVLGENKVSRNGNTSSIAYIDKNGKIYAYGYNRYGKFSAASLNDRLYYYNPAEITVNNPDKVFNFETNLFVIDQDGKVYGSGLNSSYQLADMTNVNKSRLTKLNFGLTGTTNSLKMISNNISGLVGIKNGTQLVFTFDDAISEGSTFRNIRITDSNGKFISSTKFVDFNQVIITLTGDIINACSITIFFPDNAITGKFTGVFNKQTIIVDILDEIQIDDFQLKEEEMTVYKDEESLIQTEMIIDGLTYTNNEDYHRYIKWESNYPNIASVDKYGRIIAYKSGLVVITASTFDGAIVHTITVHVKVNIQTIDFAENVLILKVNDEYTLTPIIEPIDATDLVFNYESSNESIVTVDENGHIKAISNGIAFVNLDVNGKVATVFISVMDTEYVEPAIVKAVNLYDDYTFALDTNGVVWKFGFGYKNPVKQYENIKDIFGTKGFNEEIYLLSETNILSNTSSSTSYDVSQIGTIKNVIAGPNQYSIVITDEGKAYFGNLTNGFNQIGSFGNVIDAFIGYNDINYILTSDGKMYYVKLDTTYEIVEDVENVVSFIHQDNYWLYVISSDTMYNFYVYNDNHIEPNGNGQWTSYNATNYEKYWIHNIDRYAYINDNTLYWHTIYNNTWNQNQICDATNIKDVNFTSYNLFYITNNGELYGLGSSSDYRLTQLYDQNSLVPVRIYFGDVAKEETLQLVSTNINSIRTFKKGDTIEFVFNQSIFENLFNRISLKDGDNNYFEIIITTKGSMLSIELLQDLPIDEPCSLVIRQEAIKTFFGQLNGELSYSFESLSEESVQNANIVEDSIQVNFPNVYQLSVNITPNTLSNKYLTFDVVDDGILSIDKIGVITPHTSGTTTINVYNDLNVLLDFVSVTVIVDIESIDFATKSIVVKEGTTEEVGIIYTPVDATPQNLTFASSDENIATIDANGKITGISQGVVVITLTSESQTFSRDLVCYVVDVSFAYGQVKKIMTRSYDTVALLEDGSLWSWGSSVNVKYPRKLNIENVSDFTMDMNGSYINVIFNDGTIGSTIYAYNFDQTPSKVYGVNNVIKIVNEWNANTIALTSSGTAFLINGNTSLQIGNYTTIKDIAVTDYGCYLLLQAGNVIFYDGSTLSPIGLLNITSFVSGNNFSYAYGIGIDGYIYQMSYSNYDKMLNSPVTNGRDIVVSTNNLNEYMYVKDAKAYDQDGNVLSGDDVVQSVYYSSYIFANYYYITTDGKLHAKGSSCNYVLTGDYTTYQNEFVEIKVGAVLPLEKDLQIINNLSGANEYLKDDQIIFTFNQKIYDQDLSRIFMSSNDAIVEMSVKIQNNDLIITLLEDLTLNVDYKLYIPASSIHTILNQNNESIEYSITSLKELNIVNFELVQNSLEMNVDSTYTIETSINPITATNRYLIFTSSNTNVASVDEYGVIKSLSNGTAIITISYDNDETNVHIHKELSVNVVSFINEIIVSNEVLVATISDLFTIDYTITPIDANKYSIQMESDDQSIARIIDGKVELLEEGLVTITIYDEYTNINKSILINVKAEGYVERKVIKVIGISYNQYYAALLDDGTVYYWGKEIAKPKKFNVSNIKNIISSGWQLAFITQENTALIYNVGTITNIHLLKEISNVSAVSSSQYSDMIVLSSGKAYDLNNNQLTNFNNIVDVKYYNNYTYLLLSTGYVYVFSNGVVNLIKNLTNVIDFIPSNDYCFAVSNDGSVYRLDYNNSEQTKLSYNVLNIYQNIYFYNSSNYIGEKNGEVITNASNAYTSKSMELNGITYATYISYYGESYFYIDENGQLFGNGYAGNNAFTLFYQGENYSYELNKISFDIEEKILTLVSTNTQGIQEWTQDEEIVLTFNQRIIEDAMFNSIYVADENDDLVNTEIKLINNRIHITLKEDLILGKDYFIIINESSFETILGTPNSGMILNFLTGLEVEIEDIVINNEEIINMTTALYVNDKLTLDLTIMPEVDYKYLVMSSSNESVVKVSNGIATAVSSGEAIITIADIKGTITRQFTVVVKQGIEDIAFDNLIVTSLLSEGTRQIVPLINPKTYTESNIIYSSSDETIATINEVGLVTLLKTGLVTINVYDELSGESANQYISILDVSIDDLKIKDIQVGYDGHIYYLTENGQVYYKDRNMKVPVYTGMNEVQKISCSGYEDNCLILKNDGKIFQSSNHFLQYENNYLEYHFTFNEITGLENIIDIRNYCGEGSHYYFVDIDGTLWGMGQTRYGQLGFKSDSYIGTPIPIFTSNDGIIKDFACGYYGLLIWTEDNKLIYSTKFSDGLTELSGYGDITSFNYAESPGVHSSSFEFSFGNGINYYFAYLNDSCITINNCPNEYITYVKNIQWKGPSNYEMGYLNENGDLVYCGNNAYNKTGSEVMATIAKTIKNPNPNSSISKVYITNYNIYILTEDGKLFAAGDNSMFQLTNLTNINTSSGFNEIILNYNDELILDFTFSINDTETDVALDREMIVTFNQSIIGNAIKNIILTCEGKYVSSNISLKLNQLIIEPINGLQPGKNYSLQINSDIVSTINGQKNSQKNIQFTTKNEETTQFDTKDEFRIDYSMYGFTGLTDEFNSLGYVSNFINNAILNNYSNTNLDTWIRFLTYEGDYQIPVTNNYFGTTNLSVIKKVLYDYDQYSNLNDLIESPFLTVAPVTNFPFITDITLFDANGNEEEFATAGINYITVEFNTNMDMSQPLKAYFGPDYPYTDFLMTGEWINSRTWKGLFNVYTTTGDGLEHLLVIGAKSETGYVMTKDFRLVFTISSIGAESLDLFAEAKDGFIELSWLGNDDELAIGFNIYRSTSSEYGYNIINDSLIGLDGETYQDTNIESNATYYYKMAVVYSDLSESVSTVPVSATTKDKTLPVLIHNPFYTVTEGANLVISTNCSDNGYVSRVVLYYRSFGETNYNSVDMTTYDSLLGNSWQNMNYVCTISKNFLTLSGVEYYIECYDNDGNMTSYRNANTPISVDVIKNNISLEPIITTLSKYSGNNTGGYTLEIYGNNFTTNSKIYVEGKEVVTHYINSSLLNVDVPASDTIGFVSIVVETENGSSVRNNIFEYIPEYHYPIIEGISTTTALMEGGETIYVIGNDFTSDINVLFDNVLAIDVVFVSNKILKVTTPKSESQKTVDITVTNSNNNQDTLYDALMYVEKMDNVLNISGFSKTDAHYLGGDIILVYGNGFNYTSKVYFDDLEAVTTFVNSKVLRVIVPMHSKGTVHASVVNATDSTIMLNALTYNDKVSTPVLTDVSSQKGRNSGGEIITIFGSGFSMYHEVYFGDVKANVISIIDSAITVEVPSNEGCVDIIIKETLTNTTQKLENFYTYLNYIVSLEKGIDTIVAGNQWIDAGVQSNYDLTVVVSNKLNTNINGVYQVTYKCYDGAELISTLIRVVTVINQKFEVTITLNEGLSTIKLGDEYVDAGASSNAGKVEIYSNNVDTSKAGTYKVIYVVTVQGISYYKTRYVYVN